MRKGLASESSSKFAKIVIRKLLFMGEPTARILPVIVGGLFSLLVGGCTSANFTTTVCEGSRTVTFPYVSEASDFQMVDDEGDAVSVAGDVVGAESLFLTEDAFTPANLASSSSVALDESFVLEWEEEGLDYRLSIGQLESCTSSCMTLSRGSLASGQLSETAGGLDLQVAYSNPQGTRTFSGTLQVETAMGTVDLVSKTCQVDCSAGFCPPGDSICDGCECEYSCDDGEVGSYIHGDTCDEDDQENHFVNVLNSSCTVDSLSVSSPYVTFSIDLE